MDGTLIDSEQLWTVSLQDTARWLGGTLSARGPRRRWSAATSPRSARHAASTTSACRATPRGWRTGGAAHRDRTAELFAGGLPWRPGAREALRPSAAAGWPTALVTNTGRHAHRAGAGQHRPRALRRDRLRRRGAAGKPAPDPYLRAAELLGVAPERCLAVEDSPNGRAGGRAGGRRGARRALRGAGARRARGARCATSSSGSRAPTCRRSYAARPRARARRA